MVILHCQLGANLEFWQLKINRLINISVVIMQSKSVTFLLKQKCLTPLCCAAPSSVIMIFETELTFVVIMILKKIAQKVSSQIFM